MPVPLSSNRTANIASATLSGRHKQGRRKTLRHVAVWVLAGLTSAASLAQTSFNFTMTDTNTSTGVLIGTLLSTSTISGTSGYFETMNISGYRTAIGGNLVSINTSIALDPTNVFVSYNASTNNYYVSGMNVNFTGVDGKTYYAWMNGGNPLNASTFNLGTNNGYGLSGQDGVGDITGASKAKMYGTGTSSVLFSATGNSVPVPEIDGSRLPQALLIIAAVLVFFKGKKIRWPAASRRLQAA